MRFAFARAALCCALLASAVACASPLDPLVGHDDPGARTPRDPRRVLTREPEAEPSFEGTIALVATRDVSLARGDAAKVVLAIGVKGAPERSAAWRELRVVGLDGLEVGIDSFDVTETALESFQHGAEQVGAALANIVFAWLPGFHASAGRSWTIPNDRAGIVTLSVAVPTDARPGKHEGRIELEGNFKTATMPFAVAVLDVDSHARHRERMARALASLDQPIAKTPLGKLLAVKKSASFKFANGRVDDVWERWVLAGGEVWDLANLETLGPLTANDDREYEDRALAGPRAKPCLFLRRHTSIDVIDVVERRTIARLVYPGEYVSSFAVARDGSRVLASGDEGGVLFRPSKDGWSRERVDSEKVDALKTELRERPPRAIDGIAWAETSGTVTFSR